VGSLLRPAGRGREGRADPKIVAEQLRAVSAVDGVSGVVFTFQDHLTDIDRFGQQVMPLLAD
jgi:pyrimidine oxygenase